MIKLIASDVDGTLKRKKGIAQADKDAINRAIKSGIKIAICTGRSELPCKTIVDELDLINQDQLIHVTENGAKLVKYNKDGSVEYLTNSIFSFEESKLIFSKAKEFDVNIYAYSGNELSITSKRSGIFYWFLNSHSKRKPALFSFEKEIAPISKKIAYGKHKNVKALQKELNELGFETFTFSYFNKDGDVIEIMPKGCDKVVGIKYLAEKYNIDKSEIVYFGDGDNDRESIKWVGTSVAMGNADESIKEIASEITDTVSNSGVAKYINNYLDNLEKDN